MMQTLTSPDMVTMSPGKQESTTSAVNSHSIVRGIRLKEIERNQLYSMMRTQIRAGRLT